MLDVLLAKLDQAQRRRALPRPQRQVEKIGGDKVKQLVVVKSGIDAETGKKIQTASSRASSRCRPPIQGDTVRVTGAKRDELQAAIALLRKELADQPLSFDNFRD